MNSNEKILIVTASNGENLKLSQKISTAIENKGGTPKVLNLVDLELPLFTPKTKDKLGGVPEQMSRIIEELKNADKFFFVSPEYNGGTPPALTNFIAWISLSAPNWRDALNGKTAALATSSGGHGTNFLATARNQLCYIGLNLIGRPIQNNAAAPATPEAIEAVTDLLLKA